MNQLMEQVDLEVFRRYSGLSLPRHVSYPMPNWWHAMEADEARAMRTDSARTEPPRDLSLYLHIPFCEALCKFCACNKVIQRKTARNAAENTERYLEALMRELRDTADALHRVENGAARPVRQIHYGGGSPTYLTAGQIERIQSTIATCFDIADGAEIAMEIDPRHVTTDFLATLRGMRFTRMSMGVQDFNEEVQSHVRRIQPFDQVSEVVNACRRLGFDSVNFDLIYGLPYQTVESVRDTLTRSLDLSPDRVAYYHYAQVPEKVATQRGIDHTKLPDSRTKLAMLLTALEMFDRAGYEFIGLDHFARPDEALARALREGTVQRNFQGMTTGAGLRLIGMGVSAISHLPDVGYQQNLKDLGQYVTCIESGAAPVERGKRFSFDDRLRQAVLSDLYCTVRLDPAAVERRFGIEFDDYFAHELEVVSELQRDGLVTRDENGAIEATHPLGRVLLRNVAAVFDAYLDPAAYRVGEKACFSANA